MQTFKKTQQLTAIRRQAITNIQAKKGMDYKPEWFEIKNEITRLTMSQSPFIPLDTNINDLPPVFEYQGQAAFKSFDGLWHVTNMPAEIPHSILQGSNTEKVLTCFEVIEYLNRSKIRTDRSEHIFYCKGIAPFEQFWQALPVPDSYRLKKEYYRVNTYDKNSFQTGWFRLAKGYLYNSTLNRSGSFPGMYIKTF